MRVTMRSIANRVGVSEMAVSFALRGGGRLSDETRRRIIEAAAEMGYRSHAAARSMSSGKFNCVALILSTDSMVSNLPHQMLNGIDTALVPNNYHLTLAHMPDEKLTDPRLTPKLLREWFADGLLINYHFRVPAAMAELLEESRIPAVWLNTRRAADAVRPDDEGAGRLLAEHLIELGHQRIAYVDYSHPKDAPEEHYSATDRRLGYEKAMEQAGLEPIAIHRGDRIIPDRVRRTLEWLDAPDRPSAVICYSSSMAMAVIAAAGRLGLEVPTDLSVAAIDDHPSALGPPITTALLAMNEVGQRAAQLVLDKINSGSEHVDCQVVPASLLAGGTAAPPPPSRHSRRSTRQPRRAPTNGSDT